MKKIFYTLIFVFLLAGCKKGEEVPVFEELSTVFLSSGFNNVTIYKDNQRVSVQQSSMKVPSGEALYRFQDVEGVPLLEQVLEFSAGLDTISFVSDGENSLLLRSLAKIAVDPTKLKVDVANLGAFANGRDVNLMVYKVDASSLEVLGEGEPIPNVSRTFSNNFNTLDLDGIASDPDAHNKFSLFLYVMDDDMQPVLKDGSPIVFLLSLASTEAVTNKVYQLVLRDSPDFEMGMIEGFGIYPDGSYFYSLTAQQSK